jgi:hypothetical protein
MACVYLLSEVGEKGAQLLGASDNYQSVEAAEYQMTFLDKVRMTE